MRKKRNVYLPILADSAVAKIARKTGKPVSEVIADLVALGLDRHGSHDGHEAELAAQLTANSRATSELLSQLRNEVLDAIERAADRTADVSKRTGVWTVNEIKNEVRK